MMHAEIFTTKTDELSMDIANLLNDLYQHDTAEMGFVARAVKGRDYVVRSLNKRQIVEHGICVRVAMFDDMEGAPVFVTDELGNLRTQFNKAA